MRPIDVTSAGTGPSAGEPLAAPYGRPQRWAIEVSGVVQGVGFRPFVYELAQSFGLAGFVRNESGCVWIEVEGEPPALEEFYRRLVVEAPPLARIGGVHRAPRPLLGDAHFIIQPSAAESASDVFISPDVATCPQCLAELFDPTDRRFRYPFLNCTRCGPRLTIVQQVPYDRERTTMASFAMCAACRAEYENPADRRFHAQPIACRDCGPQLAVTTPDGTPIAVDDPLAVAVDALGSGRIVAIKGLGGYHLACDATSTAAVEQLRRRKHRDEKPLAVMVADGDAAAQLCEMTPSELELLESNARPIVLLRRRAGGPIAEAVAPGNPLLGVMLAYTPLHHLLLRDLHGLPLVMTSGNLSDEPIAFRDDDARERLGSVADLFLTHNRPIHLRCDDSVVRYVAGASVPLRRSRGYVPSPLTLPQSCARNVLAVGGQLKAVFALGRERHAFLSHHIGDLDHLAAHESFTTGIDHFERLFAHRPALIVHDLHPDYASTRYALERCERAGIDHLSVQHHHAHLASCLADNGLPGPAIGVTFDGTGYGTDGAIWGGEFLIGDCREFRRAAHFRYVPMPGGERAIYEPWRMAVAYLLDAEAEHVPLPGVASPDVIRVARRLAERRIHAPLTSSVGRLFDAVAAIAGLRGRVSWEGQAAIELEWLAADQSDAAAYPFDVTGDGGPTDAHPLQIDPRPIIAAVASEARHGTPADVVARRFHNTLAAIVVDVCARLRRSDGLSDVVLSGGVFMNGVLLADVLSRLVQQGFAVHRHRQVPPNDGGLALGQLAIAAACDRR